MDAEAELARLVSLVAHEIRTPLSVVSGYVKMLGGERQGPLNEAQRRSVAGADRACQQLTALATDLSWMARIERGEVAPNRVPISLDTLLGEVAATHTPHDEHPVTVEAVREGDGDAPGATLTADAVHLRRALTSMLAAVVRGAPDHATVQIIGRPTRIALAPVSVIDDLLDAETSTLDPLNEGLGGLGVGLPLARRLVALEGGAILGRATPDGLGLVLTLPA
jgi:signal transduction histidine kinase